MAELELTRARDSLVRSQTGQALAMVNVYRSLVGAPEFADLAPPDSSTAASGSHP